MSIAENWEQDITREIIELHEFFHKWFNGTIPQNELSSFIEVLEPNFQIISPRGEITNRADLVILLQNAYAKNIGIQISADDVSVRPISDNLYVAIYTEVQIMASKITSRISSGIFRRNESLSNNYAWVHLHETWK